MPLNIQGSDSLYFKTGLDTRGLEAGVSSAKGILSGFASHVSAIDVFAGIGISAAVAFQKVAKSAYDFSKEFESAMLEVMSISDAVRENYAGMSDQIIEMSKDLPEGPIGLTQALYQVVSASYDGAEAIEVLRVASRAAVAGVTDTKIAVDGLTTVLNAFHLSASEAEQVADIFFNTVKRGKTTFAEFAQSISIVAPLAASMNISFEEIAAALQTLTKQGTTANMAITQIRSAIVGMSETLGDGWAKTMSLQEGMQVIADRAKGSETALREMIGRVEGVSAVLAMTGENAKMAAADLEAVRNSTGEMEQAFRTMVSSTDNQLKILSNNITARLKPIGDYLLGWVNDVAGGINKTFARTDNEFRSLADSWKDMVNSMRARRDDINDVIERLEHLAQKTTLDADETIRLEAIQKRLLALLPSVAKSFGENARAVDLLTAAKAELIKMDEELFRIALNIAELNRDAAKFDLEMYNLDRDRTSEAVKNAQKRMNARADELYFFQFPREVYGRFGANIAEMQKKGIDIKLGGKAAEKYAQTLGLTVDQLTQKIKELLASGQDTYEIYDTLFKEILARDREYSQAQKQVALATEQRTLEHRRLTLELEKQEVALNNLRRAQKQYTEDELKAFLNEIETLKTNYQSGGIAVEEYKSRLEELKVVLQRYPEMVNKINQELSSVKPSVVSIRTKSEFDFNAFNDELKKRKAAFVDYQQLLEEKTAEQIRAEAPLFAESAERYQAWLQDLLAKYIGVNESAVIELNKAILEANEIVRSNASTALADFLEQNKTFAEQRLAIETKYEELRAEARDRLTDAEEKAMLDRLTLAEQEELEKLRLYEERIEAQKELDQMRADFEKSNNRDSLQSWVELLNAKLAESKSNKILQEKLTEELQKAESKTLDNILQDYRRFNLDKLKEYRDLLAEQFKLAAGNTEKQKALMDELDRVNEYIFNKQEQRLRDAADAISNLGKLLSKFDEQIGQTTSEIAEMVNHVANLVTSIQTQNIMGMVGSVFGIFDSIISIFNKQHSTAEKIILKTESLIEKQDRLLKKVTGEDEITALRAAIDARQKQISGILDEIAKAWEMYHNASMKHEMQMYKALAIELENRGREIIRNLEDEIFDLQQKIKSIETATVVPEIANIIAQQFQSSKASIEDFTKTFEDMMKKAIIDSFKRQIISGVLQEFYDEFSRLSESGLTQLEIFDLRERWANTIRVIEARWNGFVEIAEESGIDLMDVLGDEVENTFTKLNDTIADSIFRGLEMGKVSVADFAENFKLTMNEILKDSFKSEVIKKAIAPLLSTLNELSAGGFDANELVQLQYAFETTSDQIAKQWDVLVKTAKDAGIDLVMEIAEAPINEFSNIADSLQNAIMEGLQAGYKIFDDFGDSINDILKDAILDAFALQVLSEPLKKLAEKVAIFAAEGYNQNEIGELQFELSKIIDSAVLGFDALKEIAKDMNIELGNIDIKQDSKGLTGAIKGITEETAGLLAGQFNALRMNSVGILNGIESLNINVREYLSIAESALYTLNKIEQNTRFLKNIYARITTNAAADDVRLRAVGGI